MTADDFDDERERLEARIIASQAASGYDREEALSRLAARNAASLTSFGIDATADDDERAAKKRIAKFLKYGSFTAESGMVNYKYNALLEHLRQSELTINFCAYKFFNKKPEGEKYVAQWEGGDTWGDPIYMDCRDEVEEAMFDYAAAHEALTDIAKTVQKEVQLRGKRDQEQFEGAVRPKYGALNYARLKYGSAGSYGKSYLVLKEYLKHNATYLHTDSFDFGGSKQKTSKLTRSITNFLTLQRLIVNMPDGMLNALSSAQLGDRFGELLSPPGVSTGNYIEAQIHSEIRYDRDIQKLVINWEEVEDCEAHVIKFNENKSPDKALKVIKPKKLRALLEKFAKTYHIELEYI